MTTTQHTPVDARTVTFDQLSSLEAGTAVSWNGLTVTHGATWSPLQGETPADYTVFADDADPALVQVMHYTPGGFLAEAPSRSPRRPRPSRASSTRSPPEESRCATSRPGWSSTTTGGP